MKPIADQPRHFLLRRLFPVVGLVAATSALGACSSGEGNNGPATTTTGNAGAAGDTTTGTSGTTETGSGGNGAGGSGETGGASGAAGTSGAPDGGTDADGNHPMGTLSNLPGVDFQVSTMGAAAGLTVASSNLLQDTGGLVYVEWFAEVKNSGTQPVCLAHVKVTFESATGAVVETLDGYAAADPYKSASTLSTACIGPGKTGVVWTNDLPSTAIALDSIKTAKITIDASSVFDGAVPHPMAPTIAGAAITQHSKLGAGSWAVSGQATATDTIYNVKEDVYFIDAAGFAIDNLGAFHLETFLKGEQWSFETISGYRGTKPASFRMFTSFIEGAHPPQLSDFDLSAARASFGSLAGGEFARWRALDEVRARRDRAEQARASLQR